MLYNVEELKKDVHKPGIVPRMADMQSQDNWGMVDLGFKIPSNKSIKVNGDWI